MPKMKTRSCVKKRFKVTGSGKVKRKKAFTRHLLTSKSKKSKRNARKNAFVGPTQEKQFKTMLQA